MKKIVLILLINILLYSCSNNKLETNRHNRFFVEEIEKSRIDNHCQYYIWNHYEFFNNIDGIWIEDSIGKFDIGDTVYLTLNKYK